MPELPEVETVRRSLEPLVVGRSISGITVGTFSGVLGHIAPDFLAVALSGRRIVGIRRRGKFLFVDLDDGSGLEVHLRMTGHLEIADVSSPPLRFEHLAVHLDNGVDLRFADQRKFGRVIYHAGDPAHGLKTKLGPEPLDDEFTMAYLSRVLARRTAPIKSLLLDQRIVAGIGNIYADEALFLSRIHPSRPAGSLTASELRSLHRMIRSVLRSALEHRGTSFSDYRDGTGQKGNNQHHLQVYGRGRKGEPCFRCGRPLEYLAIGQRTSHFCPNCQPLQPPDGKI
jgi:formamidopyrimidine-DNA glycosylase